MALSAAIRGACYDICPSSEDKYCQSPKALFHFIADCSVRRFYKPSVILISPQGGSGHLLPGGGQVSPAGSKVDGVYLVI